MAGLIVAGLMVSSLGVNGAAHSLGAGVFTKGGRHQ